VVTNRFFGLYESGEYKIRGIGGRRHDIPDYLRHVEHEILELFARAPDTEHVIAERPRALARADLFAAELRGGGVDPARLLIAHRFGRPPGATTPFTDAVAAARQRVDGGRKVAAGTTLRYLVADRRGSSWRDRVRVVGEGSLDGPYDAGAYLAMLARSVGELLTPLGVTEAELAARWGVAPTRRARVFSSAQRLGQRSL